MRVYVSCPGNLETGGTELLHQFAYHLMKRNIETYMIYIPKKEGRNPTPENYLKYGVKEALQYPDEPDCLYIVPETRIIFLTECVKSKAVMWWMSVDNFFKGLSITKDYEHLEDCGLQVCSNTYHFVQSHYAYDFVKNKMKLNVEGFLTDYISENITQYADQYESFSQKLDICLYNPRKGFEHIEELIKRSDGSFAWMPIKGLNPDQVATLMCWSKVYIDFGHHPGKDRIPREAAYCGCCIITNREGSAAYPEDVMIPEEYRVEDMEQYDSILGIIKSCMTDYEEKTKEFQPYRELIRKEKQKFEQQVDAFVEWAEEQII